MTGTMTASADLRARPHESGFVKTNRDSSISGLIELITSIDPVKPSAALAEFAGIGIRAAQLVIEGRSNLSRKAVVNLLRSRIGDRVLDSILGKRPPAWRAAEQRLMGVAALEAELDQLEQKRRHLERLIASRRG